MAWDWNKIASTTTSLSQMVTSVVNAASEVSGSNDTKVQTGAKNVQQALGQLKQPDQNPGGFALSGGLLIGVAILLFLMFKK